MTKNRLRRVLAVAPDNAAGARLSDAVTLVESDFRVQVTFTAPGVDRDATDHDGLVVPWRQAIQRDWDLILTTNDEHTAALTGPLLRISDADGRALRLDRMRISKPLRESYRRALGVHGLLVAVCSTWTPDSLFETMPELCGGLLAELPPERGCVALVLHPRVWAENGARQVKAWLSPDLDAGLALVRADWRTVLLAADWVLGDHGAATAHAAAVGTPVTLATRAVRPELPTLKLDRPLLPQRRTAAHKTTPPSGAAMALRVTMYRLLGMAELDQVCGVLPVPRPLLRRGRAPRAGTPGSGCGRAR